MVSSVGPNTRQENGWIAFQGQQDQCGSLPFLFGPEQEEVFVVSLGRPWHDPLSFVQSSPKVTEKFTKKVVLVVCISPCSVFQVLAVENFLAPTLR